MGVLLSREKKSITTYKNQFLLVYLDHKYGTRHFRSISTSESELFCRNFNFCKRNLGVDKELGANQIDGLVSFADHIPKLFS